MKGKWSTYFVFSSPALMTPSSPMHVVSACVDGGQTFVTTYPVIAICSYVETRWHRRGEGHYWPGDTARAYVEGWSADDAELIYDVVFHYTGEGGELVAFKDYQRFRLASNEAVEMIIGDPASQESRRVIEELRAEVIRLVEVEARRLATHEVTTTQGGGK